MKITPDFSEAPESQPVAPGVYKARVVECEERTAKTSGNPYLNWKLQIFGADGDAAEANNRIVFLSTMVSGKGAFKLRELCKAAGYQPSSGEPFDTDEIIGKEVEIVLTDRMDQHGNKSDFPDVKSVRPA